MDEGPVGRGEGFDFPKEGVGFGEVPELEPGGEVGGVRSERNTGGGEGLDFGGEAERSGIGGAEVEGFLAAAVTGEEEGVFCGIEDGEGEHPVEFCGEVGAPLVPGRGEDFGIAMGVEAVADLFELGAEFLPIVDFAVADGVDGTGGKGLLAVGGIKDGEAGHAESEGAAAMGPGAIRTPVVKSGEHGGEVCP